VTRVTHLTQPYPAALLPGSTLLPARPDESFERLARLAQRHLGVPVALVSLVSQDGQVYPGAAGLPPDIDASRYTPLTHSFCKYVVADASPLVVDDARRVALLRDNPAIPELDVIAYAGFPLTDDTDAVVGSMCVIDHVPRRWTDVELALLEDLSAACSSELKVRGERERARRAQQQATLAYRQAGLLLLVSDAFQDVLTVEDVAATCARVADAGLGATRSGIALLDQGGRGLTYTSVERFSPELDQRWAHARIDEDRPVAHVARTREPLFFRDGHELVAAYPALAGNGLDASGASAVLPLVSGHELLGVLTLGWRLPREFDEGNRAIKSALAAYTAQALQRAQLLEERRDVARTLQDAMLTALPQPDHLRLAARYVPAGRGDRVGGDWYDAVVLPDGGVAVMVGDVTGHDMDAAARMGQLRSMLRAFAWDRPESPASWLARLDRADVGLGLDALATALVGRIDPDPDTGEYRFTWSSAGHPAPVLVRPGHRAVALNAPNDLLIGLDPATERHDHTHELRRGETVLLHTDGLVERRTAPLTQSLGTLVETAGRLAHLAPAALVTSLAHALVPGQPQDDVVLLAVQVLRGPRAPGGPGAPAHSPG
jgi:serine phosphatase RsbU (regulator of sigma subunit)